MTGKSVSDGVYRIVTRCTVCDGENFLPTQYILDETRALPARACCNCGTLVLRPADEERRHRRSMEARPICATGGRALA